MKKLQLTALFVVLSVLLQAQSSQKIIHLKQVVDSAMARYPISQQHQDFDRAHQLSRQQLNAALLPGISLNGQMSVQSDVTQLGISVPGFSPPELAKDWYKINLDITQIVYDGGQIKQNKSIEAQQYKIKITELETLENVFKESVTKLYFRALLLKQQIRVFQSLQQSLSATAHELESAAENGIVLASGVHQLQVELLRNTSQKLEAEAALEATLAFLNVYSGIQIQPFDSLSSPFIASQESSLTNQRPEWIGLNLQIEKSGLQQKLIQAKRKPNILAFAQAGYGRPGYNMLDDQFSDYYMVGLRFNYKLWDWKTNQREQNIWQISASTIEKNKQSFEMNQLAAYDAKTAEIQKLKEILSNDSAIVQLQEAITVSQRAALQAGILTSATFLQEMEKLRMTMLQHETNKIKLLNAMTELMFITGKINFNE